MKPIIVAFCLLTALASIARAKPPVVEEWKEGAGSISWFDEINRSVPLLRHDRGNRWPLILWEPGPSDAVSVEDCKSLLARGIAQHIHLDEKMLPLAKVLQEAGAPVIMMEGKGGSWPSSLAGEASEWAHQLEPDFQATEDVHACPGIAAGWAINADRIRETLRKFKGAGVNVDAVWMDWEVDPAMGNQCYQQAIHCSRCRAILPAAVLRDEQTFKDYRSRRYVELVGTYLAAPVAEIFPNCSTTNWHAVISSPQLPVRGWFQEHLSPRVPPNFTATNPVAYGMALFWNSWEPRFKKDREHVDQFYTHFMLREVSTDTANRLVWAPHKKSVPWVCRWCPAYFESIAPILEIPALSRPRYRELLRHLWLRGIDGMQIYNAVSKGFQNSAVAEVQDAVSVYDEMLEYREFLDGGTPIGLEVPNLQDSRPIWSGLRLGNRAVVRTFKPGDAEAIVTIEPWPGKSVRLKSPPGGRTYLLTLKDGRISVVD